jgi:hypothetical protein
VTFIALEKQKRRRIAGMHVVIVLFARDGRSAMARTTTSHVPAVSVARSVSARKKIAIATMYTFVSNTQLPDSHQPIGSVSLKCGRPLSRNSFSFLLLCHGRMF